MISKEEYKNLQIGDVVSIRGTKCTIFHIEDDGKPVGVLEGNPTFGILVSKSEENPIFQKRFERQIEAGFPPSAKSYRVHEYETEKVLSKAKDKVQIKKLKKEDLATLKIEDVVLINGIERKIETLELDGMRGPWIKSLIGEGGKFPCGGDCHPQNKKLKLDYNVRYAYLQDFLNNNTEVLLKSNNTTVVENKMSKKDIYSKTIKAMKGSGYDYGTSIFAELNDCYDEIEMFFPDPDNFFLSKNLSKIKLIESFSNSIPSEFTFVDTEDPIQKDIYNVFESTSGEFVKLNCLSDVYIVDDNGEDYLGSTIDDPQKNVSADVFALYRCPATNELKACYGYDLNKILDNIKNKIYYPTGKKKISEKEAELLKRFGFTEKANIIEDSKENVIMNEKVGLVNLVKSDAQEAAYRTAAKKGVRALRAAMLRVAKDKGAARKEVNYLKKAFESDLGEAVLSMALGYMLTYAPLPETVKNNKHFGRIVGELRIGGIQIGMDTILSEAMVYVGPVLDEIKGLLPEDNEEIATALPARIAKPTTKRIKTSPKEDLDESEEDEVAEKSAKKA